jgi:hypothetical protein
MKQLALRNESLGTLIEDAKKIPSGRLGKNKIQRSGRDDGSRVGFKRGFQRNTNRGF